MNRRAFITGLLTTTAMVAMPPLPPAAIPNDGGFSMSDIQWGQVSQLGIGLALIGVNQMLGGPKNVQMRELNDFR